ncbi:MAG: SGNH/GDSL hydrolase family protein [Candidatus Omnitrophica bacterium]|nr:SGNH/GDSL hydrolase family protein [Candidatus Omnitrophota bacterium]
MSLPRWSSRLLLLACATLLALGAWEAALRLKWFKSLAIPAGIEHPQFHHRLKPLETYHYTSQEFDVEVRTNPFGLRGPDPSQPKAPGTVRILMLGDSYTFGFPVRDEETFCALVERGLKAQGLPVEVVNAGVSGSSPTLHYLALRDQFLSFDPDLVILWFDLGDVQEDHWFQKNLLYDDAGRIARCDPRYINGRFSRWEWLRTHSALVKYLDTKLVRTVQKIRVLGWRGYLGAKLRGERAKVAVARLKQEQLAPDLAEYDRFLLIRDALSDDAIQPYWELTAGYLRMIHALLAQRRIPFVIGFYPYGMLAGPDQWVPGREFWGFESGRTYDASRAVGLLARFAEEQDLPFVNTLEVFREAAKAEKLFYDQDGHFTPAGHRVLAEALVRDPAVLSLLRRRVSRASR